MPYLLGGERSTWGVLAIAAGAMIIISGQIALRHLCPAQFLVCVSPYFLTPFTVGLGGAFFAAGIVLLVTANKGTA